MMYFFLLDQCFEELQAKSSAFSCVQNEPLVPNITWYFLCFDFGRLWLCHYFRRVRAVFSYKL